MRYFCTGSLCLMLIFCSVSTYTFSYFSKVLVTEWPHIGKIAAHSAYGVVLKHKLLIVNLVVFSTRVL